MSKSQFKIYHEPTDTVGNWRSAIVENNATPDAILALWQEILEATAYVDESGLTQYGKTASISNVYNRVHHILMTCRQYSYSPFPQAALRIEHDLETDTFTYTLFEHHNLEISWVVCTGEFIPEPLYHDFIVEMKGTF